MPDSTPAARPYPRRAFVLWLSVAQLITWGSVFYGFALLVEPVERELGLSRAQSSLAFSMALLAEGLLAYPVGRLIDRGRERAVMSGGTMLVAACLVLHSQASSIWAFYAVWVGLGAGCAATLYTPVFAILTRRFPQDFRRAIITLTFLGGLASTVFIPLDAWLITQFGWRHALLALAAFQLLICLPIHALVLRGAPGAARAAPQDVTVQTLADPPAPRPNAATSSARAAAPGPSTPTLRECLRSAPFLLIGVFVVLMMGVTAALPPHMVALLRGAGLSEAWVIAIPASIGLVQVLGRLLLFFFEHRFDLHRANRLIPWLVPLGLAALLAGQGNAAVALLFVLLFGLGNGMLTIVKGTAIAQYVNREHVASLNGALGLPTAVVRALGPLALGLLWSAQAGYQWGLCLLLGCAVLASLALALAQQRSLIAIDKKAG